MPQRQIANHAHVGRTVARTHGLRSSLFRVRNMQVTATVRLCEPGRTDAAIGPESASPAAMASHRNDWLRARERTNLTSASAVSSPHGSVRALLADLRRLPEGVCATSGARAGQAVQLAPGWNCPTTLRMMSSLIGSDSQWMTSSRGVADFRATDWCKSCVSGSRGCATPF